MHRQAWLGYGKVHVHACRYEYKLAIHAVKALNTLRTAAGCNYIAHPGTHKHRYGVGKIGDNPVRLCMMEEELLSSVHRSVCHQ